MSFFVRSTAAPEPKTKYVGYASLVLAAIFVILAVTQLYSYEDFPDVIASMWLPGGRTPAIIWAAIIVIFEVGALPFLLSFQLSPAMRVISMAAGWLVAAFWLVISVWVNVSVNAITNSGLLGATIPTTPSWWLVGATVFIGVMTAYVSWGLWPRRQELVK
jgi:hypothetical protein